MSDTEIVDRLRAYLDELVGLYRKDNGDIRKVSAVIEDIEGVLEGEF